MIGGGREPLSPRRPYTRTHAPAIMYTGTTARLLSDVEGEAPISSFRSAPRRSRRWHFGSARSSTLVRVQTADVLSDALGLETVKGRQRSVDQALKAIATKGAGALLYMEPRRAEVQKTEHAKPEPNDLESLSSPKMDFRDYGIGAQVLVALGIKKLSLLSRDRRKVVGLEGYGLEISNYVLLAGK